MNNEYTMEHINRLAIGNIVSVLDEYETRIAALEAQAQTTHSDTADGFDLARYRKMLETCIDSRKREAKETTLVSYYELCHTKIEAYTHALKLLDA